MDTICTGRIKEVDFDVSVNGGISLDLSVFWSWYLLFRLSGGYTLKGFNVGPL
jgi:hypothetical protein